MIYHPLASRRLVLGLTASGLAVLIAGPGLAAGLLGAGPKKRIAVAKFDADVAFDKAYGTSDAGGGLAAQLTTELVNTGQFLVEERANLDAVLAEQKLGAEHLTTMDTSAGLGELTGAQVLIRASVTMFEPQTRSGGFSIGIGGAALDQNHDSGKIGIDLRLIDTTTGQVVGATHIDEDVRSRGSSISFSSGSTNLASNNADASIIGETTRAMIGRAVAFIQQTLATVSWTGQVSDTDSSGVFLNIGADGGVAVGDRFAVSRISKRITDPQSGELLGVEEEKVGAVRVTSVQPRFSVAAPEGACTAQRGDIARFVAS